MNISRRSFTAAALSAAIGSDFAVPAFAQVNPQMTAALAAIRSFGEADLAFNRLPGMTLGIVGAGGAHIVMNFGYSNAEARTPITPETLFQIGSITKVMVAAALHQLANENRLRLTDRISDLLPQISLPAGNQIEVQHLLDHVAGLPSDSPLFPEGGLWTGYPPGAHWHYSNTAYEVLGKLAEHLDAKPLDRLLNERIFAPLGMRRSRGSIIAAERLRYAQGYEAADQLAPYVRGAALAPAPWVDVTAGAGCVASTADDMLTFLRALAAAVQGKAALGLLPQQARLFATHAVSSGMPGMSYGNGLMHLGEGGRVYLHHTGGMVSFSSSFHLDVASGVSAFASSTLNAFAEYRPRLLTRFAVDAMTDGLSGRSIPAPPSLDPGLKDAPTYGGRYSGPAGTFAVQLGSPLTIIAGGQSAPLQLWSDEIFHTDHPLFRSYSMMFERSGGAVRLASWGPNSYAREGSGASIPQSNPALVRLAGRYINDDPWFGAAPVVERGGKLWIGSEIPMTRISDNLWRVGKESWSPERAFFANFIDGRPQTLVFSGEKFVRQDI